MSHNRELYIYRTDTKQYFGGRIIGKKQQIVWAESIKQAQFYSNRAAADEEYERLKTAGYTVIVE